MPRCAHRPPQWTPRSVSAACFPLLVGPGLLVGPALPAGHLECCSGSGLWRRVAARNARGNRPLLCQEEGEGASSFLAGVPGSLPPPPPRAAPAPSPTLCSAPRSGAPDARAAAARAAAGAAATSGLRGAGGLQDAARGARWPHHGLYSPSPPAGSKQRLQQAQRQWSSCQAAEHRRFPAADHAHNKGFVPALRSQPSRPCGPGPRCACCARFCPRCAGVRGQPDAGAGHRGHAAPALQLHHGRRLPRQD